VKRLIDEELRGGSPEHQLAELVRATPRLPDSPAKQQWIFAQVTTRAARGSTPPPARRPWLWGLAAAAVLVSAVAAAAGIALHHRGLQRARETAPETLPAMSAAQPPTPSAPASVETPNVETSSPVAAPQAVAKPAVEAPSTGPRFEERANDKRRFGGGEDPAPVLEAIRALRSHGDAARASVLLSGYLKAHPNGVLAEDALALSIESAIAQHDTARAADLGRRYLTKFPNGRYRAFATQATQP
jgi:hypothetical protein